MAEIFLSRFIPGWFKKYPRSKVSKVVITHPMYVYIYILTIINPYYQLFIYIQYSKYSKPWYEHPWHLPLCKTTWLFRWPIPTLLITMTLAHSTWSASSVAIFRWSPFSAPNWGRSTSLSAFLFRHGDAKRPTGWFQHVSTTVGSKWSSNFVSTSKSGFVDGFNSRGFII